MGRKFAAGRFCAVAVALGVVFAGCTGPAYPGGGGSSATAIWPTHESSPTQSASPTLTDEQLYQLAVSRYRSLYKLIVQLDQLGGVPELPEQVNAYVMDPARQALAEMLSDLYTSGDRYVATPHYQLLKVARLVSTDPPEGSLVSIQTCETVQGAAMVSVEGEVLQDGSLAMMYRRGYFKIDPSDGQLKLFEMRGEVASTCPVP